MKRKHRFTHLQTSKCCWQFVKRNWQFLHQLATILGPAVTPNSVTPHRYATYGYAGYAIGYAKHGYATSLRYVQLRRLRQIRLRHMVTPHTVMLVTPSVTPHGYATYGTPSLRVTPSPRVTPRVTPQRHSTASLPRVTLGVTPARHSPRHSLRDSRVTPTPPRHSPHHSPRYFSRHSTASLLAVE